MSTPLIFTEQRLLPRWIDIIITALAWFGFVFLLVRGFLEMISRAPHMGPIPLRIYILSGLTTIALYLAIAAFNAVVLIIWANTIRSVSRLNAVATDPIWMMMNWQAAWRFHLS